MESRRSKPEILPCKGRWQHAVLTEGCPPIDGGTPLRLTFGQTPPLQGEDEQERTLRLPPPCNPRRPVPTERMAMIRAQQ